MEGAVLRIETVTVYWYSAILALSFLWGAFAAYKKAVEAHMEDIQVLDTVVMTGFWSFVLSRLIYVLLNINIFWNNWPRILFLKNYPGLDHLGLLLGIVVALLIAGLNRKQKFFDWLDFAMTGMVGGMSVYFAGMMVLNFSWISLAGALVSLGVFVYLWRAERVYRTYGWYKNKKTQSRTGFLSGTALSFYGLTHIILSVLTNPRNIFTLVVNLLLFVGGFVIVYSRSGRNLT
jgi:prolipoprotein diacylglyceryltransferase